MYTGKVDIGTGIRIALPQMVAEELDVALDEGQAGRGRHRAHARPGADVGQPLRPGRRRAAPPGGGHRAPGAHPDGRAEVRHAVGRLRREGRRHLPAGRAAPARLLRRADRRPVLRAEARPGRARSRTRRTTPSSVSRAAAGHPRQGHRHPHLHAGLPRARHAARPRRAAAGHRRHAPERGRVVGQEHQGRAGRAPGRASSPSSPRASGPRSRAAEAAQGDLVELGGAARSSRSSGSTCATRRWPRTTSP